MIEIKNKENCCGCFACVNKCPVHCISMKTDTEGFLYPEVDKTQCINCGLCKEACPCETSADIKTELPEAYAIKNKDTGERMQSSSGGVFVLLAKEILRSGGIVYGAAFGDDCKSVHHASAENIHDLQKLMGSKYLQSEIGSVFREIKQHLEGGRTVLFSGTPCQVEGLKAFLAKHYVNLLTVDIICHGVPSPMVWRDYLNGLESEQHSSVSRIYFRNKTNGWKKYSLFFEFENGCRILTPFPDDPYMKMFLRNLILRPSCCACHFKKPNRVSDITLADLWGIQNSCPEMDDDKGTSFVMVHSSKGREFTKRIAEYADIRHIELQPPLSANPAAVRPVAKHRNRDKFFREYAGNASIKKYEKYLRLSFTKRLSRKIKSVLRNLKKIICK